MKKQKRSIFKLHTVIVLLSAVIIVGLVSLGYGVWQEYKNTLMRKQEEQLLIISRSLGRYMGISLENYEDGIRYLADMELKDKLSMEAAKDYIDSRTDFVSDVIWFSQQDEAIKSVYNTDAEKAMLISNVYADMEIWQLTDKKQTNFLGFRCFLPSGDSICLLVDEEKYYKQLISDLQIGTNGYVMIKSSQGKIIMHPDEEQWGIDVVEGRKEMYPWLDFDSLEEMVEEQQLGKEGISEYYSYWWTNSELPRVKKVSAYAPAKIGEDFWIISTVTDYDDLYIPIAAGFLKIMLVFLGILIVFSILLAVIVKLLLEGKKAASEINYLKELNGVLEDMHRSEETIRHQQRLQIMGTMTGGIVHEFNNFLTPILGHAELLKMMFTEDSEEYDSANEIYEAAEKAKDVIRQISSLSRKNVETVYKTISVKKMVSRFLKMAESVCPSHVRIESQLELGEESILGNTTQINQVLLNIFVNAVQAIDGHEGKISVQCRCIPRKELEEKLPDSKTQVWEKFVCIDIKDSGCGMDSETLRQIFDPFFTTKKAGQGTGLGLALAEQIILSHKGLIYAESEWGYGTVFHIIFPVMENEERQQTKEKKLEQDCTFVIVDDNMKVLRLLDSSLKKLNVTAYTCKTKAEVFEYLEKNEGDALFIDETVEDMGGVELCMALRNKYPEILMFIMSSRVTKEVVEAKQNGIIDGYVEKPVSDVELIGAVRLGIQNRR